ncbi:hypothetical protein I4U23_021571 [Adineta vaga]|nr:hypothetical protein I4U23_021571 [Adineta vaga]
MSHKVHKLPHIRRDDVEKSHSSRSTCRPSSAKTTHETIINTITGYENDLGDKLAQIDREAEIQVQQIELTECLLLIAQLVELFKHTIITSELQNQDDWHKDTSHHLRKQNGATGNTLIDDKIEEIVLNKGLTKQQWTCLLYISFSNSDTIEITKTNKKHLQKIHDKALRLLEIDERDAVFALIHAIETYMSKDHFSHQ